MLSHDRTNMGAATAPYVTQQPYAIKRKPGIARPHITLACGSALALLATAAPALAQQSSSGGAISLEEIVVTAARADRRVSETPASVNVIDRAEIERQLQFENNPAALLSKVIPGYSVNNQTISGASEGFRGRDLLVMIDGVPLNMPLRDVSRILALIDLNAIERVEVVAGASSLYGAGATGGTANFTTKKAADGKPRLTTNTSIGAFTHNLGKSLRPEASATLSGKTNGIDYLMVGTGRFANRTYDGAGRELPSDQFLGQGGGDRFATGNFLGKLGYDFDNGKRFEMSANYIHLNQRPDYMTLYGPPYSRPNLNAPYTGQDVLEDTWSLSARYSDQNFALGKLSVLGFYNDIKKQFPFSGFDLNFNQVVYYSGHLGSPTAAFNQTAFHSQRGGVNVTVDTPLDFLVRNAKLTWGLDIIQDSTTQTLSNGRDVFNPMTQRTYAGFAQLEVPVGERLKLRGGVRYEYFDLTVDNFVRPTAFLALSGLFAVLPDLRVIGGNYTYNSPTYNFGGTYKITDNLDLHGNFSQGYALPDVGAYTRRAGLNFGSTAQILPYTCAVGAYPPPSVPFSCPMSALSINYGNLGILAQVVNSYELGLRWGDANFRGNVVGYVSTSDRGVTFDSSSNTLSQQKERIWGVEGTAEVTINPQLNVGAVLAYREGRYDTNKDGVLDSYLPNNRITTPFHGTIYADYKFENGGMLRVEGQGFTGRDRVVNLRGDHYKLESGQTVNVSYAMPLWGGTAYIGVQNLFDWTYQNPTATSVRELAPSTTNPVYAFGRMVNVGFRKTW